MSAKRTSLVKCKMHRIFVQFALMNLNDRLRWARERAGFATVTAAAARLGVNRFSYAQHENGTRGFKREAAELYARRFGVSLSWLLTGRGEPKGNAQCAIVGFVGAGATVIAPPASESSEAIDQTDAPPGLTTDAAAVVVRGDSMWPTCEDGDLLFYDERTTDPMRLINKLCICWAADGRVLIKRLRRGSALGLFTLDSANVNMPPIQDIRLDFAAPVLWIKRG